ncbi:hypothetical protein TVAG_237490 [Trichomonas vaginalis G3]|uniref:RING-type domain-containing protein n=1 Tax=Trichomonas vaginalis (strain ATCC PRA-98 / G3) TaxID=412133 RepID=A2DCU9_TRIV3|nr:RING zinc finger protein family [Trichomonas vaginalis G3]EAY21723.1 hypothetical protein TVAG_237490 [Trichomonas vaginalis G3]KAI5524304.1 RING zinc finger protein family [Trichomonas vaginalis G3]|eukprot:XP_001582709.1 hypothetical protein [Trichomonas vaginalis G3]
MNSFRRFIMNFKKYANFTEENPVNLPYSIEGIFTSIALSYEFSGIFLNISNLKAEYAIYGVVISILLIFSHYMWRSIHRLPPSLLQRNSISILSIVLICSFDASIINSLTDKFVTQLCPPYLKYFLIVCYLLLFLVEVMPEMVRFVIAIPKEKRTTSALLYTLFGLISIFICCRLIVSFSFIPLLFTAGPWFAQVILNAVSGFNANLGFKTLAFFSISRAIYFAYSFLYTKSIFNAYSIPKYIFVIIILLTQLIVLPFQSYISAFLLSKKKPQYSKRDPPEGAICPICLLPVTMGDPITTPCNHTLHLNCLKRWLEQKYTCPVCRSDLPELPLTMK